MHHPFNYTPIPMVCIFCGWKGEHIFLKTVYGKPDDKGSRVGYSQCPNCLTIETTQRDNGEPIIPIRPERKKRNK